MEDLSETGTAPDEPYRVLARKYRPGRLDELKGQAALVRTLTNALGTGRVAHAFMLTGVRGVGKTTTARIIARALNCIGPDGKGGPTPSPCGVCEHCVAIAQDRHVDVLEMDAASRTGIDDIREIIESVRYAPASARTKVYIIDEVHMLSKAAFNGLLKTLEEPPPHVKFVFATTEIRRVPVTVLSRCQRFDLRRVEREVLEAHYGDICAREKIEIAPDALRLIAISADGSVRDGLSLLDQAMALYPEGITRDGVAAMLGLADRARLLELLEAALKGEPEAVLSALDGLHASGADPLAITQDMLALVHEVTRLIAWPNGPAPELPEVAELARQLNLPAAARAWQLLLKGLGEIQQAPDARRALDMVMLRLVHAADLPDPARILARLEGGEVTLAAAPASPSASASKAAQAPTGLSQGATALADPDPLAEADPATLPIANPRSFVEVVALFREQREGLIAGWLEASVRLVRFAPPVLAFQPGPDAPADLAHRVTKYLRQWTGQNWMVRVDAEAPAEPTLVEQAEARSRRQIEEAARDPKVKALLDAIPGAEVVRVHAAIEAAGIEHPAGPDDLADDDTPSEDAI